jgi:hypothetical protein
MTSHFVISEKWLLEQRLKKVKKLVSINLAFKDSLIRKAEYREKKSALNAEIKLIDKIMS